MLIHLILVEVAGVEPASRRGTAKTSTCLFHLQLLIVRLNANGQAFFPDYAL